MPYGYNSRILHVDLTSGAVHTESPTDSFYRQYPGGRALIAYYLYKLAPRRCDPLGPENVLVFAPGVITGAAASGQGRNGVGAKSPLTGGIASSEVGGYWGSELKRAGYDAIVVTGRAAEPVYLWVQHDQVEIRPAGGIWGLEVGPAEEALWDRTSPKARTCLIGPAGENLVRYACVVNDRSHYAGRGGLGAVMGSKLLKGIAVLAPPGPKSPMQIFDKAAVTNVNKWQVQNMQLVQTLHDLGTAHAVVPLSVLGGLPVRYFNAGSWPQAVDYSGEKMKETILAGRGTCASCAVRCKREVEATGRYPLDRKYGGPEYESLSALGNNCGIADLNALAYASERCAALGMDAISLGMSIAYVMEMRELGHLSPEFLGGVDLRYGDTAGMLAAVEAAARRSGVLGDLLAEGTQRIAERLGPAAQAEALTVKGQEVPLHEPRIKHVLGLGYAVSPTGADHMHNLHDTAMTSQNSRQWRDMQEYKSLPTMETHGFSEEKLEAFYYMVNYKHALDSLVMCHFLAYPPKLQAELVRAVTGWADFDHHELLRVGVRAQTMSRMYNLREGLTATDDRLPAKFFKELADSRTGKPLDPAAFEAARRSYYERMGWDRVTGVPTPSTLADLGIEWMEA